MFGEETRKRGRSGREWVNGVREKMGWKILGGRLKVVLVIIITSE